MEAKITPGQTFAMLTAIEPVHGAKGPRAGRWVFKCACGQKRDNNVQYVLDGRVKSCGCTRRHNFKGQTIGSMEVIGEAERNNRANKRVWLCRCLRCQKVNHKPSWQLQRSIALTCSCARMTSKDLSGEVFGLLTVNARIGVHPKHRCWLYTCDCACGNKVVRLGKVLIDSQRNNKLSSCGCGASGIKKYEHGTIYKHPLYKTWCGMHERCSYPKAINYVNYGGRGIAVCGRWQNFQNFADDMGAKPTQAHTLDRIDNDGPYSPANCRWATRLEQKASMRKSAPKVLLTLGGKTQSIADWATQLGIRADRIRNRRQKGMPVEDILSTQSFTCRKTRKS